MYNTFNPVKSTLRHTQAGYHQSAAEQRRIQTAHNKIKTKVKDNKAAAG